MGNPFVVVGVIAGMLGVCGVFVVMLLYTNRKLTRQIAKAKVDLTRTSKILIEKNLELVDQTLSQQKQLELKDDFISIVSHQLRTPITEIKWNVDAMLRDKSWALDAKRRTSLELLYDSVGHSLRLIDDLVHLVSVEQGAVRLAVTPYSPDEVVQTVSGEVAKRFAERRITLSVNLGCPGASIQSIDSDSLGAMVGNLVENAFHYTLDKGKVEVHTRTKGDEYEIVVSDTGIGMSPEQQKAVFTKFRRGAGAIRVNARGSGLGLYIVKKILEQHGGTIAFESAEQVGTTFTLHLPYITRVA